MSLHVLCHQNATVWLLEAFIESTSYPDFKLKSDDSVTFFSHLHPISTPKVKSQFFLLFRVIQV